MLVYVLANRTMYASIYFNILRIYVNSTNFSTRMISFDSIRGACVLVMCSATLDSYIRVVCASYTFLGQMFVSQFFVYTVRK